MKTLSVGTLCLTLLSGIALAGPPMICHPLETGQAVSLPWSASGDAWDGRVGSYDRTRLVADTLELLKPETPVIARMETLRRAAIYADTSTLAVELADRLTARSKEPGADALAAFDAGYFIESVHQNPQTRKADPLEGRDGYSLAKQSSTRAKDAAAVEYGLCLMIGRFPNDHFRKAKLGAKEGSLLAQNVRRMESK